MTIILLIPLVLGAVLFGLGTARRQRVLLVSGVVLIVFAVSLILLLAVGLTSM